MNKAGKLQFLVLLLLATTITHQSIALGRWGKIAAACCAVGSVILESEPFQRRPTLFFVIDVDGGSDEYGKWCADSGNITVCLEGERQPLSIAGIVNSSWTGCSTTGARAYDSYVVPCYALPTEPPPEEPWSDGSENYKCTVHAKRKGLLRWLASKFY